MRYMEGHVSTVTNTADVYFSHLNFVTFGLNFMFYESLYYTCQTDL